MRTCGACEAENPDQARFCLNCAAPFGEAPTARREVRKVVTVVFCDLTGSTELGELLDAEPLQNLLDVYFDTMSRILADHGGTVEKFIGDAVVAVFGVPLLREDDALRAVRASLDMAQAMRQVTSDMASRWGVAPQVRIGVNTGEVVAGAGTGDQRLATGDAMNVAARLQSQAPPGGVVLGRSTYRLVREAVDVEPLGTVRLKGKSGDTEVYRLLGVHTDAEAYARNLGSPLVGRREELDRLLSVHTAVSELGHCRRAVVVGMAGVGKSRLVQQFLHDVGPRSLVLTGRCRSYGRGVTFWPLRGMLGDAAGWVDGQSAAQAQSGIADLLPGEPDSALIAEQVAQLLGLSEESGSLEEGFWAFRRLLEGLSRWQPLIVVVDDVHWAEPGLLDLVEDLRRASGPIMVVCLTRPDLFDTRPDWLEGDDVRLDLDPLPAAESDELVEAVLGSVIVPPAVRDHVRAAAEGNPLYVEQMLAMLVDDGVLVLRGGEWVTTRELAPEMLPDSLHAVVQARLERLPVPEQVEMQVGAVMGRVFWREAVAVLAGPSVGAAAGSQLPVLVRRALIRRDTSELAAEAYRFSHALIRDAAYAALPKAARANAHVGFADWLERLVGDRVVEYGEILGFHRERAYEFRRAVSPGGTDHDDLAVAAGKNLSSAGQRAFARGDTATAVDLLRRAHRLLASDPGARLSLVPAFAQALSWGGDVEEGSGLLSQAEAEATAWGDAGLTAHVQLAAAGYTVADDPATAQLGVADAAVATFTASGDREGLAQAWMLAGRAHFSVGRTEEAERAWQQALPHAQAAGSRHSTEETTLWLACYCFYGPTPLHQVAARLDVAAGVFSGKPYREAILLRVRAFVAACGGEFATAYRLLATARLTLDELGQRNAAVNLSQTTYEIARRHGDYTLAVQELTEDAAALADMGDRWVRSTTVGMLAHALHETGRFAEAQAAVDLARELTNPDDALSCILWRTALAKQLARRRHGSALPLADEAVTIAERTDWLCMRGDALLDRAAVLFTMHLEDEAVRTVDRAIALYARKGDNASLDRALTARHQYR